MAGLLGDARLELPLQGLASPTRIETAQQKLLTYYNPYRDGLAWAGKYFLDDLPEDQREAVQEDVFKKIPGLRRVLRLSNPEMTQFEETANKERRENSKKFQQDLTVEHFVDGNDREGYLQWLDTQLPDDVKRLESKWKREWLIVKNYVDKFPKFWLSQSRKAPRIRAASLYREWAKLDTEKDRKELLEMVWKIPGYRTKDTYLYFLNFKRIGKKEAKESGKETGN